jgi:hypothetical protein
MDIVNEDGEMNTPSTSIQEALECRHAHADDCGCKFVIAAHYRAKSAALAEAVKALEKIEGASNVCAATLSAWPQPAIQFQVGRISLIAGKAGNALAKIKTMELEAQGIYEDE